MRLIATKPLRYATRHLQAGDEFAPLSARDGKLLIAAKRAKPVDERTPGKLPPPPASLVERVVAPAETPRAPDTANETLKALRIEYRSVVGRNPFNGWSEAVLRERIAAAREGA